jgi:hypothetical protein
MRNSLIYTLSVGLLSTGGLPQSHSSACGSSTPRAELFAPTLADSGRTFRGVVVPDRHELYFFRKVTADPQAEDYRIFVSRVHDGTWSRPEQLRLGGDYSDLYPTLSPDGRRLVFTSYRPMPGDTSDHPNASLWYADRTGTGWGRPIPIRAATKLGSYHSQPVFLGDSLVFRRTSPDWRTNQTLVTRWDGHAYDAPTSFEPVQRWVDWRTDLRVWGGIPGPDGIYVVLEVSRLDRHTRQPLPSDLWVSVRAGGRWTEPRPMGGGVNAEASTDNFPMISSDGCDLMFVRDFSMFYRVSLQSALAAAE